MESARSVSIKPELIKTAGEYLARIKPLAKKHDSYLLRSRVYHIEIMYEQMLGNYQEAIVVSNKLLSINPGSTMAYENLAVTYERVGEKQKSEECKKKAEELKRK